MLDSTTLLNLSNVASQPYIYYNFNRTASANSTTLTFKFATHSNRWLLDAVVVQQVSPSTLQNLIINGGFETGNLHNWSKIQSVNASRYVYILSNGTWGFYSQAGSYYYYDGTSVGWTGIQQTIATVIDAVYGMNPLRRKSFHRNTDRRNSVILLESIFDIDKLRNTKRVSKKSNLFLSYNSFRRHVPGQPKRRPLRGRLLQYSIDIRI